MPTWWRCWMKATESKKTTVNVLDLSHQSLIDVPNDIFNHERTLEELYLNSNRIYDLPRQLFLCLGLKILNVSDNDLTRLPNAVQDLKNIHHLDLSKNAITVIPDLSQLHHLNVLNLSLNPLDRIPDTIYNTNNITELYLNDTNLTYIVANIGKLINLTIFEIRENKLTTLPESISRLKKLKRLDVGQNELTTLPTAFGQICSLTELSLDLNYLEYLPDSIAKLTNLIHLDISFNNISNDNINSHTNGYNSNDCDTSENDSARSVSKYKHSYSEMETEDAQGLIQTLYLNNNNLSHLPSMIFNMSSLTTLRVEGNFLTNISSQICKLVNLEELCLTSNNLTSLPASLGLLKRLKVLMLDDNLLECLPKELSSCDSLTILSVRNNKLTHLIPDLGHLTKLAVVNVVNNRLRYLPVTLLHLEEIKAIWLSATQSKPLVPLQREMYGDEIVLTCVLLPQMDNGPPIISNETLELKQNENDIASSVQNKHINFSLDCATKEKEPSNEKQSVKLNRSPTPYPKQLKQMAKNLKAGSKVSPNSEIKEARIITSLDSSNLDKFDSFVVYEQNVVIRQAKNTKSTDLLEKNYDNTDTESTMNCYNVRFYGDFDKEVANLISPQSIASDYNTGDALTNDLMRQLVTDNIPGKQQQQSYHERTNEKFVHTSKLQSPKLDLSSEFSINLSLDNQLKDEYDNEKSQQNNVPYEEPLQSVSSCEHYDTHHTNPEYSQANYLQEGDSIIGLNFNMTSNDASSIYQESFKNDFLHNETEKSLFMENNASYTNRGLREQKHIVSKLPNLHQPITEHEIQSGINKSNIYTQSYEHWPVKKMVPPPYHVAKNYSKHAKYYDAILSHRDSNSEQYTDNSCVAKNNNFIIGETNSPVSVNRSQMETPLSAMDDDRYSIQNFVDNQMQEPYVIKPKAHKLTTDHGDYHYVIQNKFNDTDNPEQIGFTYTSQNSLAPSQQDYNINTNLQKSASKDNNDTLKDNSNYKKAKKSWMFGQHKNVKVVDCNIYNIDFAIEYRRDQGIFVKSVQDGSCLQIGDKLLQIGEENVYQLIGNLNETESNISKLLIILNQLSRPFKILVSRQS